MSVLDTWVLKYQSDVDAAIQNLKRLEDAQRKVEDGHKQAGKSSAESNKQIGQHVEGQTKAYGKIIDAFKKLKSGSGDMMGSFKQMGSGIGEVFSGIGAGTTAMTIAVAAGALVLKKALADVDMSIDRAVKRAEEARATFGTATAAHLSTGELLHAQAAGSMRGARGEDIASSMSGVGGKMLEFEKARREAARNPASSFNNPVLKAAALWRKAGIQTNDENGGLRGVGDVMAQQDKYLRALKEQGETEKAIVEGVQLFGRSAEDVRTVLASTNEQFKNSQAALAKEANQRRDLQAAGEDLAITHTKLEAAQKSSADKLTLMSIPAVKEHEEAMIEWTKAIQPLKEGWQEFVNLVMAGCTGLIKLGSKILNLFSSDTSKTPEQIAKERSEAGDRAAQSEINRQLNSGEKLSPAERKKRIDAARAKGEADYTAGMEKEHADQVAGQKGVRDAMWNNLIKDKRFAGYSQSQLSSARSAAEKIIGESGDANNLDKVKEIMLDQLSVAKETGKTLTETNKLTAKVEGNTRPAVNVGLEQALALWAGSRGQGGIGVKSGMGGETMGHFQARSRANWGSINPNTFAPTYLRGQLGAAGEQGARVVAHSKGAGRGAAGGAAGAPAVGSVSIDKVEIHTQATDADGIAKHAANSLNTHLKHVVGAHSSPIVS